ncbi:hypothetical protein NQZ68_020922 [Dissostichus eleginoides]|nr:hypothetical protein NQZ68_020922 [Dissostichus eleginoides]
MYSRALLARILPLVENQEQREPSGRDPYHEQALKIERFERSTGKRKCQQQGLCGVVFRKPLTLLPDRAPSTHRAKVNNRKRATMSFHSPSKRDA